MVTAKAKATRNIKVVCASVVSHKLTSHYNLEFTTPVIIIIIVSNEESCNSFISFYVRAFDVLALPLHFSYQIYVSMSCAAAVICRDNFRN